MKTFPLSTATVFHIEIDGNQVIWNVTELQRDASTGLFGPPVTMPMRIAPPNYKAGFLDLDKVKRFKSEPKILNIPAIGICASEPGHIICFVDGNHRLVARWEMGLPTFQAWLVPNEIEQNYRIRTARVLS